MTAKATIHNFQARLRLDSHHSTEWFGAVFAAFALLLVLLVASLGGSANANTRAQVSQTAVYTTAFTTSKTDLSGKVTGIYTGDDRTRSLVMMQFDPSAASAMSADAGNYQAFVTGSSPSLKQETLANGLAGEFVVFGSTGYVGMVLDSDAPFERQILNLTMRANSELVYGTATKKDLREDLRGDTSFLDFDQWRVFVNPGADEVVTASSIGGADEEFSPSDAYYELVVAPEEAEVRIDIDTQLAQMQVDLNKINEYTAQMATANVGGVKIVPPAVPVQIAGDTVTGTPGTEAAASDSDASPEPTPEVTASEESEPLELHTTWVSPKGYNFDWRDGSVHEGYLDALVPSSQSYVQFLGDKASTPTDEEAFTSSSLVWQLTDGSNLATDYSSASAAMAPLMDVMNNLSQAYQNYYNHKIKYQTEGYDLVIALEVSLLNVDLSSTTNNSEDALLPY